MSAASMSKFLQRLRRTLHPGDEAGLTDGQLLERFISRHDEAAFAVLVRRHGPMVWGVCRRVLRSPQDAEDAFQATFLVLVRKAASIVSRELLASWLYGVAHRTALKAKASAVKRQRKERPIVAMSESVAALQDRWHDLLPLLDQALSNLPDKYRVAIILCDLEGKTRKEAARQLGCPEGTVAGRLARARTMLAKRLARHGVEISGASLAVMLSENAASAGVPIAVVFSTIEAASLFAAGQAAATGVVSAKVAALTEGVLKTMLLTKLKTASVVLLVVAALNGAAGLIYQTQVAPLPNGVGIGVLLPQTQAAPLPKVTATIDGLVDGKKVQPDAKSVESGAKAAVKLLAASNLTNFYGSPQNRPMDKADWQREVSTGIENKRSHLRIQFGKPKQIEGKMNGEKIKYSVSEVVFFFFEPGVPQGGPIKNGPVCLWGRDGDKYYFANQIAGHEALVKWLGKAQKR